MLYQKGWSSILPPVLHKIPWLPLGCVAMPGMAAGSFFGVFVPIVLKSCLVCFSFQRLQDRGCMPQPPNLNILLLQRLPLYLKEGNLGQDLEQSPAPSLLILTVEGVQGRY